MSDNLRLQVILNAVDKLTRPFNLARESTQALAKEVKSAREKLNALNKQAGQLSSFRETRTQLAKLSHTLKQAQQEAQQLGQQFSRVNKPTAEQARLLRQARDRVKELNQAQRRLRQSVQHQREALRGAGIDTQRLAEAQKWLKQSCESASQSLQQQQHRLKSLGEREKKLSAIRNQTRDAHERAGHIAATGVAMAASGAGTLIGVKHAVDEASAYAMEMARFKALGVGDDTLTQADKFARGMDIIGNSAADNLKTLKEAHAVLRDFHEAQQVTPELARLQFATRFMSSHGVSEEAAGQLRDQSPAVLKIAELRNQINNPQDFKASLNMTAQAMAASGGMVLPDDYMAMMKTGGIAAKQMNDKAFYFAMSHIIQQVGGDRAGTSLSSAYQNVMMGRTTQGAAEELMKLGLLDKNAVRYGKTGHIKKILPGALNNSQLYQSDPFAYLMQEMVPRIKKTNPKLNEQGMETAIAKLFSSRTGADLFVTMYRERSNIHKQITAGQSAFNVDQLVGEGKGSAQGQQLALQARTRDLYLQMGQNILPAYVSALEKVAKILHRITDYLREHPKQAHAIAMSAAAFAVVATALGGLALAVSIVLGPLALLKGALQVLGIASPVSKISGISRIFARFGGVLLRLIRGPIAIIRIGLMALGGLIGGLSAPVIALLAVLAVAALAVWKYWQPIKAFISGFIDGFSAAAQPIIQLFEPLKPVFGWIGDKLQAVWNWFTHLLTPVKSTAEELDSAASMGKKFGEYLADGLTKMLHPLDTIKSSISWLLDKFDLLKDKSSDTAKAQLKVVSDKYKALSVSAGFASTNNNGKAIPSAGGNPYIGMGLGFSGFYDNGGTISAGHWGVVGEQGPELVRGPASVTSRTRTAALASVVAGLVSGTLPPVGAAGTLPLHPQSLSGTLEPSLLRKASTPVTHINTHAPITIMMQPGQSPQDVAREVARQLDERERRAAARARSSYRDQGGYDL